MTATASPSLAQRVREQDWYHVLELPGGVVTRGHFDTRAVVGKVPMPASLAGKRCLDVGTWDGFWAFEMERRGAAEVVAVDLAEPQEWDWPAGGRSALQQAQQQYLDKVKSGNSGFRLAHEALGSKVERREMSVYDLSPEKVGEFDFCFLGTLLMHLRDPAGALSSLASVCRGEAVIADGVDLALSLLRPRTPTARLEAEHEPWWWQFNRACLRRLVEAGGWEVTEATGLYFLPQGPGHPRPRLSPVHFRMLADPKGRERLASRWLGVAHAAVRAKPLR